MQESRSYTDRAATYLENMTRAADLIRSKGIPGIIALQPFLPDKIRKTASEKRILSLYDTRALIRFYPQLRTGLQRISKQTGILFIDSSDALNVAPYTIFCDIWHFTDSGHRLLARRLAEALSPLLNNLPTLPQSGQIQNSRPQ